MAATATVTVFRLPRMSGAAVAFKVKIDGVVVGKVRLSSTVEFPVEPGRHTVQVTQWMYRSAPVTLDLVGGQRCELITKPKLPWLAVVPRRYLALQLKDPATGA